MTTSQSTQAPRTAGIILCGGESRRMRQPKWSLPFGAESMLDRIARVVGSQVTTLIIVGPARGPLPRLASANLAANYGRDREAGRGPLEGIAVGLGKAIELRCAQAFITACDTPLLEPEFVAQLLEWGQGHEAAIVRTPQKNHYLPAAYSCELLDRVEELLAERLYRVGALAERAQTRWVTAETLEAAGVDLRGMQNVNTPEEYQAALAGWQAQQSANRP